LDFYNEQDLITTLTKVRYSVIMKAALFNHIKKHHLCTDNKLIKMSSNLKDLYYELKIESADFQASKEELLKFQSKDNISTTCFGDEDYPSSFYHLDNPPAIIYYSGNLDLVNQNYNLAIVGTRNSSLYGEHCCRCIVESLEDYNVTFISGLARGIDLICHKSALRTQASSIAVIGSGLLAFSYYGEQKVYFEELRKKHLVISEYHPKEHASKRSFALRNRLIAALSNSTVVVEAPKSSGALITAKYCLDLDRGLYAIPGDLNKKTFEGGNILLAENKAKAIFQASKAPFILGLDEFSSDNAETGQSKISKIKSKVENKILKQRRKTMPPLNCEKTKFNKEDPLIDLLDSGINDFDLLLFKSHYQSSTELVKHLTDLEIQGKVTRRGALFVTS
jgi:DNA processing protein